MDFMTAVKTCLTTKYLNFEDRAQRSEYWWFVLALFIANIIAAILDGVTGIPIFTLIVTLGLLIPSIAAGVRRLHDLDKSGWWLLISLVPIVGFFLLLYWFVQRGTEGDNRFGPDPLA